MTRNTSSSESKMTTSESRMTTLYAKDKKGTLRQWSVHCEGNETWTISGIVGMKLITSARKAYTAVNVGKKNELSAEQKANEEMKRMWLAKISDDYKPSEDDEEGTEYYNEMQRRRGLEGGKNTNILKDDMFEDKTLSNDNVAVSPMLAHKYEPGLAKCEKYFDFKKGVIVQKKCDGIRCITYYRDGKVFMQSRNAKYFNHFTNMRNELKEFFVKNPNVILDGELYTEKFKGLQLDANFQQITRIASVARTSAHENEDDLQYFIYDMIVEGKPQSERTAILNDLNIHGKYLVLLESKVVHSWLEAQEYYAVVMAEGYEGIMLRSLDGLYEIGKRSNTLRKYKEMAEMDATITGYTDGKGREAGKIIFICKADNGAVFNSRPTGTEAERSEWFLQGDSFIGKPISIRYQTLSDTGTPKFNVAVVRDYE